MYNFMRGGLIVDVFFNYLILSIEKNVSKVCGIYKRSRKNLKEDLKK